MTDLDGVFARLGRSAFRSRFRLRDAERRYLEAKGLDAVMTHAAGFVATRLAPAEPANDGRQTPTGKHPAFVAQHATATCCRGCLAKWHGIAAGHAMSADEQAYVLRVIRRWLEPQARAAAPGASGS